MNIKIQTIWTIVLSFFIIIGAGHGVACIGLLEIFGLSDFYSIGDEPLSLLPAGSYEESLGAAALFALIGHIILIVSFFLKEKNKFFLGISGIIFLWISFYYLVHYLFTDSLALMGFLFGLPFLICSVILFYRLTRQRKQVVS
jgi:hypothetical protein